MNNVLLSSDEQLQIHPACLIIPPMADEDYAKLKEDISGFGLRHPIVLYQGMVLDGRHRYRACIELGIEPTFIEWQGGSSVIEFVLGENLHRRHLTKDQKAAIAVDALEYHREEARKRQESTQLAGRDKKGNHVTVKDTVSVSAIMALTDCDSVKSNVVIMPDIATLENGKGKAAAAIAKTAGVSTRTAERVIYVKEHGDENDLNDVKAGKKSSEKKIAEIKARQPAKPIVVEWITPEQWEQLDDTAKQAALVTATNKKFNIQDNDSIDWAAYSWNPITGCNFGCPYCYARDIANRFYGELGFNPALHPDRLLIPSNYKKVDKQNNRVFTCSMSDLFGSWVPKEWINAVLSVCAESPMFDFLLLTKNPKRLTEFDFPRNCWVGTTTDTQVRMNNAISIFADVNAAVKWVSVEPMFEPIMPSDPSAIDWYVIGGASATTQQNGFIPPYEWVFRLALAAHDAGKSVFIKTNFWNSGRPQLFPSNQ